MHTATIKKILNTPKVPSLHAFLNQAVVFDRIVFVSGVIGIDASNNLVVGGVVEETRQAFKNIGYILEVADSSFDKVLRTNVYLEDMNDIEAVNDVYQEYFTDFPAGSVKQVSKLHLGAKVEIEVIAATGDVKTVMVSKM